MLSSFESIWDMVQGRLAKKHAGTPAVGPAVRHLRWADFSGSPTPAWPRMRAMAELAMAALAPPQHYPPAIAYTKPTNSWCLTLNKRMGRELQHVQVMRHVLSVTECQVQSRIADAAV